MAYRDTWVLEHNQIFFEASEDAYHEILEEGGIIAPDYYLNTLKQ